MADNELNESTNKFKNTGSNFSIVNATVDLHLHSFGSSTRVDVNDISDKDGVNISEYQSDIDLHGGSHDGRGSTAQLFNDAKKNNVKILSITEHNTMASTAVLFNSLNEQIKTYNTDNNTTFPEYSFNRVIHRINGIDFIPGVEITCVIPGVLSQKNKPLKVHMLVYGAQFDSNSIFHRLLKAKHHNDLLRDQGLFKVIEKEYGIKFSETLINKYVLERRKTTPGFGQFGVKDVLDFLNKSNITIGNVTTEELRKVLKDAPEPKRLQLNIADVIKIAHAAGGICILAHPNVNLDRIKLDLQPGTTRDDRLRLLNIGKKRVAQMLLGMELDGFEAAYNARTTEGSAAIRNAVVEMGKERQVLYTGGSDNHINGDPNVNSRIGRTRFGEIKSPFMERFLSQIKKLDKAREQGKVTHRIYRYCPKQEIEDLVVKYENLAQAYQDEFHEGLSNYIDIIDQMAAEQSSERDKTVKQYATYDQTLMVKNPNLYRVNVSTKQNTIKYDINTSSNLHITLENNEPNKH